MSDIKIALVGTSLMTWGGGIDFLIDFIKTLEHRPGKYSFEVLLPKDGLVDKIIWKFLKVNRDKKRIIECLSNQCSTIPIVYYKERLLFKNKRFSNVKKIAIDHRIDILMTMDYLMKDVKDDRYITVSYIFDFQHKKLPELFSDIEIQRRDKYFEKLLSENDYTITQSYDTKKDIETYYKDLSKNVYVLYAYPHVLDLNVNDGNNIFAKYNIIYPYFIVCNQFWAHKNHIVVFDAIEDLFNKGINEFEVVFTGDTSDFRNPRFFNELQTYISKLNCRNRIKILGYIDKSDQINLLKHSIALIQPTLFEGNPGGGAVVDAMAYGVPCLVSDIPVNLEIPQCFGVDNVSFFSPRDARKLSNLMDEKIKNYKPNSEFKSCMNYDHYYELYDNVISDMIKMNR